MKAEVPIMSPIGRDISIRVRVRAMVRVRARVSVSVRVGVRVSVSVVYTVHMRSVVYSGHGSGGLIDEVWGSRSG